MAGRETMKGQRNYSNLTKDQLISHILQLESGFQDFSTQSSQVEDLLQQQLNSCLQQLEEKDNTIREMSTQLDKLESTQMQITALETDNDLLESTIRNVRAQLECEVERHNECIEKIAFLESELEWFKTALKPNKEPKTHAASTSDGFTDTTGTENYINKGEDGGEAKDLWLRDWKKKEESWTDKINLLQSQLDELSKSKAELENKLLQQLGTEKQPGITDDRFSQHLEKELQQLMEHQDELVSSLRQSEQDKEVLKNKLKYLQNKYTKVSQISAMVKLRQRGLAKAYTTPALDPIA